MQIDKILVWNSSDQISDSDSMTDTTRHCGLTAHLIIPELRDFLVLHGRIIPDEVGGLVIIPGLDETHLTDDYPNYRRKAQLKGFL